MRGSIKAERLCAGFQKAIGITLRKKYLDSREAQEDEKDERTKDRPQQIGNTLLTFHADDKSMKELFKLVKS